MDCVNLKERFGRKYRVTYEESYYAQYGPRAQTDDPWLQIIPCRRGHIFPWGDNILAASTNGRGPTAHKLAALDFTTISQDGDDGVTMLFPVERFPEVAELMKPRRRRQVSDQERQRLLEIGAKHAFQHGTGARPERQGSDAMAEVV